MNSLIRICAVSVLLCLYSCENPNKALYNEVMRIHDEVMPRMNDLYKIKLSLQQKLDTAELDTLQKEEVITKIAQIDAASDQMMIWMREFDPFPEGQDEDSSRAYLQAELLKIEKVRSDIMEALKE